jgi:ubiquitin carboxyl-terminal hydrolase 5/13
MIVFLVIKYSLFISQVKASVNTIIEADSAAKLAELEALAGTWDGEIRVVTK